MKSCIHYILFAVAFLLTFQSFAQNAVKESISVPLTNPGKPGHLKISLVTGSIKVSGYNGNEVVIDASSGQRYRDDDEDSERSTNGLRRISSTSLNLTAKEVDNRVTISSEAHRKIDLAIRVPRNFSLKLGTVNGGDITVENVSGELEISNVNGGITLTDIAGSAVVNTVNGDIVVKFTDITADTPMAFSTLNGNVDVTFPARVRANTKIKSDRGDVFTDFELTVDNSRPKVEKRNESGVYKVSIDNWVYGKINGGGPEMMLKNMNGNIYLRKGK